ncbi:hypothetical protein DIRU0_D06502 [Diutina rugosa]
MRGSPRGQVNKSRSSKAEILRQFRDTEPTDDIFGTPELGPLPQFASPMETLSSNSKQSSLLQEQKRKRAPPSQRLLDEFSEESTNVTSPHSEDEFIGLDEVDQEYGEDFSSILLNNFKKVKQRNSMLAEEEEKMYSQWRPRHDPVKTLRQKPSNLTARNLQYNDKLMDKSTQVKEFVRDDGEDFAAGFDDNFEARMAQLAKLQAGKQRSASHDPKLHSMMGYNFNEGVKKRISRFPSLNRLNEPPQPPRLTKSKSKLSMVTSEPQKTRLSKEEQLARYRKFDEKAPVKVHHTTKMQTIRCMPEDMDVTSKFSSMRLNKERQIWEGNETALARFEQPQPHFIPKYSADSQMVPPESDMVLDHATMRWTNLKQEEEDIFSDIPDLTDDRHNILRQSSSYKLAAPPKSVGFTMSTADDSSPSKQTRKEAKNARRSGSRATFGLSEFELSDDLLKRFEKEQEKIEKKVNNWFSVGETYDFNSVNEGAKSYNRDYYWEIRKMVLDS